jgi:hypothetical protein
MSKTAAANVNELWIQTPSCIREMHACSPKQKVMSGKKQKILTP